MQDTSAAEVRPIPNPEAHIAAAQFRTMQASADLLEEGCLAHVTRMVPRSRTLCHLEAAVYHADSEAEEKRKEGPQSTEPLELDALLRLARSDGYFTKSASGDAIRF